MEESGEVTLTFPSDGFAALAGGALGTALALVLAAGISREEWVEMCAAAFDGVTGGS